MKISESQLNIVGLFLIALGLCVSAINEFGGFQSQKRIAFYHRIFHSEAEIPRDTDGFDDFLKSFPPLPPTDRRFVSGISPRILTAGNEGGDVWTSVTYIVNGNTSAVITDQAEVEKWAYKTNATKIGLFVSLLEPVMQFWRRRIGA